MQKEEIREMTLDDLDIIIEIETSSFTSPWSKYAFEYDLMHNPHATYFVYLLNKKITGYSGLWIFETVGHIVNMAVLKAHRRKGIARKLLFHTMDYGREQGVERFTLEVRAGNHPAKELYKKNGFVEVGIRPQYYQDNHEDAVIMWTPGKDGGIKFD